MTCSRRAESWSAVSGLAVAGAVCWRLLDAAPAMWFSGSWEVEASELAEQFGGLAVVGAGRVLFGSKQAQVVVAALKLQAGDPLSGLPVKRDAFVSRRPAPVGPSVHAVLRFRGQPQVAPTVIETVAVLVVNELVLGGPRKQAVHVA